MKKIEIYVIDRFEDEFAVCENQKTREMINIPISSIPKEAKEGDCIKLENGIYVIDEEETKKNAERIQRKMDMFKNWK